MITGLIELILKQLIADKGKTVVGLLILAMLFVGGFYFGIQTKDFVDQQRLFAVEQKKTSEVLGELLKEVKAHRENAWTYGMQRSFTQKLKQLNEDKLMLEVPSVSEIKEEELTQ